MVRRRRVLATVGAGAFVAGCLGDEGDNGDDNGNGNDDTGNGENGNGNGGNGNGNGENGEPECPDDVYPDRPDDYESDVTGSWCWFQERRMPTTEDYTYLGWTEFDEMGTVSVARLDHETGQFDVHREVGDTPGLSPDDHNSPGIYVKQTGEVMVWYSSHNTDDGNQYRVSEEPYSIDSFGEEHVLEDNQESTYPMPFYLTETEEMFYFYRDAPPGTPNTFFYFTSDDEGETWSDRQQVFEVEGGDYSGYMKVDVTASRIDICYSRHPRGAPLPSTSVRHFYYDGVDGEFKNSHGESLEAPVTESDMTQIWDAEATGRRGWIWDVQATGEEPVIAFITFPDGEPSDQRYHYAKYIDGQWIENAVVDTDHLNATYTAGVVNEPQYAPGISLGHDQGDDVLYLSRNYEPRDDKSRGLHLEEWSVGDDYASFEREREVASGVASNQFRPIVPRSMRDEEVDSPVNVAWLCCQSEAPYLYNSTETTVSVKAEIETRNGRDVVDLQDFQFYDGCL